MTKRKLEPGEAQVRIRRLTRGIFPITKVMAPESTVRKSHSVTAENVPAGVKTAWIHASRMGCRIKIPMVRLQRLTIRDFAFSA